MNTREQFGVDLVFLPNHAHVGDEDDNTERHDRFIKFCETGKVNGWTSKKTAEYGDLYLFWFGGPIFNIAGIGVSQGCDGEPVENQGSDWTDAEHGFFCHYEPLVSFANPITIDAIKGD